MEAGSVGSIEFPALRFRLRCSACGARPNDDRLDCREHRASGLAR